MSMLMRVHSKDIHEHVACEVGECLESGLYTDLIIRCGSSFTLHAHKLVLAAASPFLKQMFEKNEDNGEVISMELTDCETSEVQSLLDIIYKGEIEATIEEMRKMLLLAHRLYISIPISPMMMDSLQLSLPPLPPLISQSLLAWPTSPIPPSFLGGEPGAAKKMKLDEDGDGTGTFGSLKQEFLCPICNSKYYNLGNFHQHIRFHEQEMFKTEMNKEINTIVSSSYDKDKKAYFCFHCKSYYTNCGNFKQHIIKHEKEAIEAMARHSSIKQEASPDKSSQYVCNICNSIYSHAGNYKQHMLKHEREKRQEDNHLNNVLQSAFAEHVDNGDTVVNKYECHYCGRYFKHPGNYKQHMASHSRATYSSNSGTPKKKSNANNSNSSVIKDVAKLTPTDSTPSKCKTTWDCPECGLTCVEALKLQLHMSKEHDIEMVIPPEVHEAEGIGEQDILESPEDQDSQSSGTSPSGKFYCATCEQVFKSEGWLLRHKQKVHGDFNKSDGETPDKETYICEVGGCQQVFTKEGWLKKHREKVHMIVSPSVAEEPQTPPPQMFPCKECDRTFDKLAKLNGHMRTHNSVMKSPESKYIHECDICFKKFTRPQHVTRHKLLHTGEKPHVCKTCNKGFSREDKLKRHILRGCSSDISMDNSSEMLVGWNCD